MSKLFKLTILMGLAFSSLALGKEGSINWPYDEPGLPIAVKTAGKKSTPTQVVFQKEGLSIYNKMIDLAKASRIQIEDNGCENQKKTKVCEIAVSKDFKLERVNAHKLNFSGLYNFTSKRMVKALFEEFEEDSSAERVLGKLQATICTARHSIEQHCIKRRRFRRAGQVVFNEKNPALLCGSGELGGCFLDIFSRIERLPSDTDLGTFSLKSNTVFSYNKKSGEIEYHKQGEYTLKKGSNFYILNGIKGDRFEYTPVRNAWFDIPDNEKDVIKNYHRMSRRQRIDNFVPPTSLSVEKVQLFDIAENELEHKIECAVAAAPDYKNNHILVQCENMGGEVVLEKRPKRKFLKLTFDHKIR